MIIDKKGILSVAFMIRKHKLISILITVILSFIIIAAIIIFRDLREVRLGQVQGTVTEILSPLIGKSGSKFSSIVRYPTNQPEEQSAQSPPAFSPTPTLMQYSLSVINAPNEMTEGGNATFNWIVNGPRRNIPTTAIYFGTVSHPGILSENVAPVDSVYSEVLGDFLDGQYTIPLEFIGYVTIPSSGKYFYRGYALVDGRHLWSQEKSFTVNPLPKHEIILINPPARVSKGENIVFTWEILGPVGSTTFTTIVIGKLSKPGELDAAVDIPKTPYATLVKDFTNGTYNVPLRFVGNARIDESGEYYFRALTFIDNKNIWSPEYPLTVQ